MSSLVKFNFAGYTSSLNHIYRYTQKKKKRFELIFFFFFSKKIKDLMLEPLDEVLTSVVDEGSLFIYLNNKIFSNSSVLMHFSIQGS
jgi:hypothetical protein